MTKWLIIGLSVCAFLFLSGRLIYNSFQNSDVEKKWYLENLDIRFSAEVDTVILRTKYQGFILFHVTEGDLDKTVEDKLNEQLVHNHHLKLFVNRPHDQIEIFSKMAYRYRPGDSLVINTSKDQLLIFRNDRKIFHRTLMELLKAKDFFLSNSLKQL
ncbi:MAG: hypothetical protein WD824_24760 [Cyclobacteriaceae bacterium]